MRSRVGSMALAAVVVAAALVLTPGAAKTTSALPPNLQPLPARDVGIQVLADGTRLLRFTTTTWNSGLGPLEIVGGEPDSTSTQKVYQRVYDDAGGFSDHLAGSMDWHEAHGHVHFNDFARYTLRAAGSDGQSQRFGEKVTFCLLDTDRINHRLDGAPKRAVYTTCTAARQGISVGWGDSYGATLPGQEIDITGLPDGDYELLFEIDPKNRLIETDDGDNTVATLIRINGTAVEVLSGGNGPGRGGGRPNR